jgi:hypothetical protein
LVTVSLTGVAYAGSLAARHVREKKRSKEMSYVFCSRAPVPHVTTPGQNCHCFHTTQPDVAPVGFECDGQYFYIGGLQQVRQRKKER